MLLPSLTTLASEISFPGCEGAKKLTLISKLTGLSLPPERAIKRCAIEVSNIPVTKPPCTTWVGEWQNSGTASNSIVKSGGFDSKWVVFPFSVSKQGGLCELSSSNIFLFLLIPGRGYRPMAFLLRKTGNSARILSSTSSLTCFGKWVARICSLRWTASLKASGFPASLQSLGLSRL